MKVFNFSSVTADGQMYESPEVEVVQIVSENSFCGSVATASDDPDDFMYGGSLEKEDLL